MKQWWQKIKKIKHLEIYVAVIALVVMAGIYFSTLTTRRTKTVPTATITNVTTSRSGYAAQLEDKLQSVLSNVVGVGKVAVMVMTDGEGTSELAYDTQEKTVTQTGANGQAITTTTTDHHLVTNNGQPVVLWTKPPTITGIIVVATGASDVRVRLQLLRAVETVIGDQSVAIEIITGI